MYQDVLIATDGTDASETAIERGVELADQLDATVHALTVRESPGSMQRDQLRADPDEEAEAVLEAVVRVAERADVPTTSSVREGTPQDEIVAFAEENDVDLVVVGTHARSGLDSVLVGSVAEAVVERSPVPVVTVRPEA